MPVLPISAAERLRDLDVTPEPAGGRGLALDDKGAIPASVLAASGAIPTGAVTAYAGSSAPTGWLLCDGSAVSRAVYSALFNAIGTGYGTGDGSTTFNLPDLRGRAPVGLGTHVDVDALNDNDGLAVGSRRPKHTHSIAGGTSFTAGGAVASTTTDAQGPAYVVVNFIIKT